MSDTFSKVYDSKVLVVEEIKKEASSSASTDAPKKVPVTYPSASFYSIKDMIDLVNTEDRNKYIPMPAENKNEGKKSVKQDDLADALVQTTREYQTIEDRKKELANNVEYKAALDARKAAKTMEERRTAKVNIPLQEKSFIDL